jgi:hypothetical protein
VDKERLASVVDLDQSELTEDIEMAIWSREMEGETRARIVDELRWVTIWKGPIR